MIIGIILAYLKKEKLSRLNNIVYLGVASGIISSLIAAALFNSLAGGFVGAGEQIFEGVTMFLGAILLTTMILWMMKQKNTSEKLRQKLSQQMSKNGSFGLFSLVFMSVLREGVETVLFLGAATFESAGNNLIGSILGIIGAIFLGYLLFAASVKVNIKTFFNVSSFFLILFAAGLILHSVHEFEEAKILPETVEHVWDLNPSAPLAGKGIFPIFHENGFIGGILVSLFGYSASPSLLQVIIYILYISIIAILHKSLLISSS